MRRRPSPRLTAGLLTALVWALLAGSALFWALRMGASPLVSAQVADGASGAAPLDQRSVARMLGAADGPTRAAPAHDVTKRLTLRGIVTYDGRGAALIAVDGQPPKPVRVGAVIEGVDGGWTVQSLTPRAVVLAAGEQQARLEMPLMSERSNATDAKMASAGRVPPPAPPVKR
ncbi:type II secretion system protein N [Ottowia sp.]|uniref:type II secretion system protein N n=1 Tax=Ottowia sp. TaxID=1898956 RepID=UPI003A894409